MDDELARRYVPRVVHVDSANRIVELGADPAAPVPGAAGLLHGGLVHAGAPS
jgi:aspartate 1-decarboxylase